VQVFYPKLILALQCQFHIEEGKAVAVPRTKDNYINLSRGIITKEYSVIFHIFHQWFFLNTVGPVEASGLPLPGLFILLPMSDYDALSSILVKLRGYIFCRVTLANNHYCLVFE